jgi:DNA repair exonuclease SbcCD ATPase subunit
VRVSVSAVGLGLVAGAGPAAGADPPPPVELDQLLRIPKTTPVENVRHGGATRSEWKERFAETQENLEQARAALAAARKELEGLASEQGNWQMAAPGMPQGEPENSPVSYRLLQEIRRQREEVARYERRLRDLQIEANLAGVPDEWIAAADDAPVPGR